METLQDVIKIITSVIITTLITIYISGIFSRNKKIRNSATKDDLNEYELKSKQYTDEAIFNHEKVHKSIHDMIEDVRKDNIRVETKVERVDSKIDKILMEMIRINNRNK